MKKIFYILVFTSTVFTFSMSCSKEKAINVNVRDLNPDNFVKGPLDDWITKEYLNPYNIEVVYRWKRELSPVGKELVPPREDKVQAALEAVRDTWLVPYLQVAGKNFIKPLAPKQIVLHGSEEFNDNGTITLGTADGGRRVVLNIINRFDKSNRSGLKQMMRTVHHEFAHIINQMVLIDPKYQEISRGGYLANWTNENDSRAKELGFVSRYARMSELEDFAEMISHLLVEGQFWFDNWVKSSPEAGAAKLRLKERAVRDYFLSNFNIDFKELQNVVGASIDRVSPLPTLTGLIRSGSLASISGLNPTSQTPRSTPFLTIYNNAVTAVAAIGGAGRVLNNITLQFDAQGRPSAFFEYRNAAGNALTATVDLDLTIASDESLAFAVSNPQRGSGASYNNFNSLRLGVAPFINYLTDNKFLIQWANNIIPGSQGTLGGLFVGNDPASYFYGTVNTR